MSDWRQRGAPAVAGLWVVLLGFAMGGCGGSTSRSATGEGLADATSCNAAVPPTVPATLLRSVRARPGLDCELGRIRTDYDEMILALAPGSGPPTEVHIAPRGCLAGGADAVTPAGPYDVAAAALSGRCEATLAALLASLAEDPRLAPIARTTGAPPELGTPQGLPEWLRAAYIQGLLPLIWLVLLVAGGMSLWLRRRQLATREHLVLGAIVMLGAVLRLVFPPGGPGNPGFAPNDAYVAPELMTSFGAYGRGADSMLALAFRVLPTSDDTFIALVFLMALGSIAALHAFAKRLGYSPGVALVAALLLATAPLHVRFSANWNRYIPAIFLALAGWSLLVAWIDERRPSDLLAAFAALTLAPQFRPDLAAAVPLLTLLLLVPVGRKRLRAHGATWLGLPRLLWGVGVSYIVILVPPYVRIVELLSDAATHYQDYASVGPAAVLRSLTDPAYSGVLDPAYTPWLWGPLFVLGLLLWPGRKPWPAAWLLVAYALALFAGTPSPHGGLFPELRHSLFGLAIFCLGAAAGVGALTRLASRWQALREREATLLTLLGGLAAGLAAVPMAHANRATLTTDEYWFLRGALPNVPDRCTVVTLTTEIDPLLSPEAALSASAGRRHYWRGDSGWDEGATCVVYFANSKCALIGDLSRPLGFLSDRERQTQARFCADLRARTQGPPIAEATLVAGEEWNIVASGGQVPVGLYWLKRP